MFKEKNQKSSEEEISLKKQVLIFVWEVFKVVVISLAIILPIRYYLIKPFYVKGASMEPNFHDREYLIINEISYRFNDPERGDAVVFKYPEDKTQFFIKRVIGLPGERVLVENGRITIFNQLYPEGIELIESYLPTGQRTLGEADVTLGQEEYFLLGDNRSASLDSRIFGPVHKDLIVGKTLLRGWPLDKAGLVLNNLEYNL